MRMYYVVCLFISQREIIPKIIIFARLVNPARAFQPLRLPAARNACELSMKMVFSSTNFAADISRFVAAGLEATAIEAPESHVRDRIDESTRMNNTVFREDHDNRSVV